MQKPLTITTSITPPPLKARRRGPVPEGMVDGFADMILTQDHINTHFGSQESLDRAAKAFRHVTDAVTALKDGNLVTAHEEFGLAFEYGAFDLLDASLIQRIIESKDTPVYPVARPGT